VYVKDRVNAIPVFTETNKPGPAPHGGIIHETAYDPVLRGSKFDGFAR
jgi:hypothetical protein